MSHKFRKPKPISAARRAAARANGAKAQGPVTPEGKAKSALNATTHGLTARGLVLTTESNEKYQVTVAAYREEYDPQGPTENALVDQLAAADWLQRRSLESITALLDVTMDRMEKEISEEFENIDNGARTALAFDKQASQSPTLALLNRYATRHARDYHRALDKLRAIQADRLAADHSAPLATRHSPPATPTDHRPVATDHESELATSHQPLATETGHPPLATDHCEADSPLATRHSPLATDHSPLATRPSPLILQNEPKPAPVSYNNPTTIRRLDDQPTGS